MLPGIVGSVARVTLYLPEPLYRRYHDEIGSEVNLSAVFQAAVRQLLAEHASADPEAQDIRT